MSRTWTDFGHPVGSALSLDLDAAGEITVHVGDPAAYGSVSASVWAGEVRPGPFGESQEGIFLRFSYGGPGRYHLQAKLKAGDVTFQK